MLPYTSFTTIDDALQLAEKLTAHLRRLGSYKHPLAVRRGVEQMNDKQESKQLKGSGRTYFFDVAHTKEGKPYLKITESRKSEGEKWQRTTLNVFPEDTAAFAMMLSEMVAKLN